MKVLVIGATGMLAKPVISHLAKKGFELRLFSRTIKTTPVKGNFEIVNGDLFHTAELKKAVEGCDAIHINLSKVNEHLAAKEIVKAARKSTVKLISYVSGCTVSQENSWFWMIKNKYQAEQAIRNCGIPFIIFRPTWFFESLKLMIRNGRAIMIGKQSNPYRWVAADDYARMVAKAYQLPEARNKVFYIYGNEPLYMKDLLRAYCKKLRPDIKKVSTVPIPLLKIIATLLRKKDLKIAASLYSYFEKVKEPDDLEETGSLLGKPEINFDRWLELNK